MDWTEFKAAKQAMQEKWGEKLVHHTAAEREQMVKEAAPLARFAKLYVDKFLWAMAQDWQARKGGAV